MQYHPRHYDRISQNPMSKLDLHVHLRGYSDSLATLSQVFARCRKTGLDGVAITDHNTITGALLLAKTAPYGMTVIIGEEISSRDGEVLGYFLETAVPPELSLEETLDAIHKQGGLACVPHPFGSLRRHLVPSELLERFIGRIDFLETFNARNLFCSDNAKAAAFAAKYAKPGVAGSDAHTLFEIGGAWTELPEFSSPQEFVQGLRGAKIHTAKMPVLAHGITACVKAARLLGLDGLLPGI